MRGTWHRALQAPVARSHSLRLASRDPDNACVPASATASAANAATRTRLTNQARISLLLCDAVERLASAKLRSMRTRTSRADGV